ncbi:alpha/beta fold hydrolase [Oceaniserpentilla sp. 4NH20-0058]|uniref:alpha/beta hydrolase family protein n=1 Tax=Oceaniserpentilla sp. 4NH20-0058 TaxID=3127660 RepID=UPI00310574AC
MTTLASAPLAENSIGMEDVILQSANHRNIHAKVFHTQHAKSVVILAPAMGVVQKHYEKFALFLTEQNHEVITFDYFGTGASLQGHVKDCDTDVRQWGELDCEAVIHYAKKTYPNLKLQWVGHSVGGQLLGFIPSANQLDNAITIACGSGYWPHNSPPTRNIVWIAWYFIAPICLQLYGYFPGKKLNIVGDLAPNVLKQWRRWCMNKEYSIGVEGPEIRQRYADVEIPISSISFSDDHMISQRNTLSLHSFFEKAQVTQIRINPKEISEKSIGHLGWSREKLRDSLWSNKILPLINN